MIVSKEFNGFREVLERIKTESPDPFLALVYVIKHTDMRISFDNARRELLAYRLINGGIEFIFLSGLVLRIYQKEGLKELKVETAFDHYATPSI